MGLRERTLDAAFARFHGRLEPLMLRTKITPRSMGYQEIYKQCVQQDAPLNFDNCYITEMSICSDGTVDMTIMVGTVGIAIGKRLGDNLPLHLKAQIQNRQLPPVTKDSQCF